MAGLGPLSSAPFYCKPAANERFAMSNVFTIDSMHEELRRKYAPLIIEFSDGSSVELKALLKLGKKKRDAVIDAITELNELEDVDDEDDDSQVSGYAELVCETIEKAFKLICTDPDVLVANLGDEDPHIKASLYTSVLNRWIGETQVGEAESSPS